MVSKELRCLLKVAAFWIIQKETIVMHDTLCFKVGLSNNKPCFGSVDVRLNSFHLFDYAVQLYWSSTSMFMLVLDQLEFGIMHS